MLFNMIRSVDSDNLDSFFIASGQVHEWQRGVQIARPWPGWRSAVEHDGVALTQLRPCDPDSRDSRPGCAKVYIPAPAGDWGAVLRLTRDSHTGHSALYVIAFGLRHPPAGRRTSVYQLAHRRLDPPAT